MVKHYLKIALRNLLRHKGYSFLNIIGLSVGMAASILIVLYVRHELSFDRFHENADRTYRITADWSNQGDSRIHQLGTPYVLAQTIRENYPQVEFITQINGPRGMLVKAGEKMLKGREIYGAEPSFFDVFSFPFVRGDRVTSLKEPNSVVVSKSMANALFGAEDPVGRTIELDVRDEWTLCTVTGIVEDPPENSHFRFDMLVSMRTLYPEPSPGWTVNNYRTYLTLRRGVTKSDMEEALVEIDKVYMNGGREHTPWVWTLEPLPRIHLYSDLVTGNQPNGSISYVRLFGVAAVLILIVAAVNFVILATARSARRAKEVGLRKVVGSLRSQLIMQFLGESVLLSLAAMFLALILVHASLPFYESLAGFAIPYSSLDNPLMLLGALCLALAVGVLAGLYPAFFLSSFKLMDILRGSTLSRRGRGAYLLHSGLVIFQFSVSVILILGSFVIFRQLDFVKNQRLGFDKEHVIIIRNTDALGERMGAFKDLLEQKEYVIGATAIGSIPGEGTPNWGIGVEGVDPNRPLNMNFQTCDEDFAEVLSIHVDEGRFMSAEFPADKQAVVLNRKAADYLGIDQPLGKKVRIWWFDQNDLTIIGIIDNVYFESLHQDVTRMGYVLPEAVNSSNLPYLLVKFRSQSPADVLSDLRDTWESVSAGLALEFSFLDETVDNLYRNDEQAGTVVTLFSFLAIFVSALGLFGLAAFVSEQRTKEIGVRKVFGASVPNLLWLLTRRFVVWVFLANLIAWPVGYLIMSSWLENFAYRTSLALPVFIMSGMIVLVIALITVGTQVIRAALARPVESLRYE